MPNPASAGDLRFRVRFDRQVLTTDPYGGSTSAWSTTDNGSIVRWAKIKPMMGGEGVQAARLQGTQPVLLTVRRDSSTKLIDGSWRAVQMLNGSPVAYFALKTAQDMEMDNSFVTMLAISGAADGGAGA